MSARVFTFDQFTGLHDQAEASPRLRQHLNIHASHDAPFQRLFIAFGMDSYVRPHWHHLVPKDETLVAVQCCWKARRDRLTRRGRVSLLNGRRRRGRMRRWRC